MAPLLTKIFVSNVYEEYSFHKLISDKSLFKNFKFAVEAIDVTFQMAKRPSGNMQEGKLYFSKKHNLYGYKVEVTVRPNGIASSYSKHYPGSTSDINILYDRKEETKKRLSKCEDNDEYEDSC